MYFRKIRARSHWKQQANELGYLAGIFDDPPYWIEAIEEPFCAVLTRAEIEETIVPATTDLIRMGLEAVEEVCFGAQSESLFEQLGIPSFYREPVRASWRRKDRSLYGRFDFSYANGSLKLLEMNFDTAISLYEASVFQQLWLEDLRQAGDLPQDCEQFTRIHEYLLDCFEVQRGSTETFHFASIDNSDEDEGTAKYLMSCAVLAGLQTQFLHLKDIGFDDAGYLRDLDGSAITKLFKLYPWEYLFEEDQDIVSLSGKSIIAPLLLEGKVEFIEPAWKTILANKGILPILWSMFPDSPWLLESAFDKTDEAERIKARPHVRKPLFGREGGSVAIVYPDQPAKSFVNPSHYGKEGFICQALHPLPKYEDYHVLLGSWCIAGKPAGIGIRADLSPITTGMHCLFVPHYVEH